MICNTKKYSFPIRLSVIISVWMILPQNSIKLYYTSCVSGTLESEGRGVRSIFGLKWEDKESVVQGASQEEEVERWVKGKSAKWKQPGCQPPRDYSEML